MWQGLVRSGRWDIVSPRESAFFLLKGCQQAQHIRCGNSAGTSITIWWCLQQYLECLFHGGASIQIDADVVLRLGHCEQTSRNRSCLRDLACMGESHYIQRHPFERFLDICWLIPVPTE